MVHLIQIVLWLLLIAIDCYFFWRAAMHYIARLAVLLSLETNMWISLILSLFYPILIVAFAVVLNILVIKGLIYNVPVWMA